MHSCPVFMAITGFKTLHSRRILSAKIKSSEASSTITIGIIGTCLLYLTYIGLQSEFSLSTCPETNKGIPRSSVRLTSVANAGFFPHSFDRRLRARSRHFLNPKPRLLPILFHLALGNSAFRTGLLTTGLNICMDQSREGSGSSLG